MVKRWMNFVVLLGCCVYAAFSHTCDTDADCAQGKVCRLICKKTCSAICVTTNNFKSSRELKGSSEEPFAVDMNPFDNLHRDESVTPLTISEAELEAELKQGLPTSLPLLPPLADVFGTTAFPTPPSPIPEEPAATTLPTETNSPSQQPHPPSIEQHESGYLPLAENATLAGVAEPPITVTPTSTPYELTTPPLIKAGGYDNEVAGVDLSLTEKVNEVPSTLPMTETTLIPESSQLPSFPTLLPGGNSTMELPFTEVFNATLEPFSGNNHVGEEDVTGLPNAVQGIPVEAPSNGCPPPPICEKNCGVSIDEQGCQSCQCLWLPIPCEDSADCVEEGQFCDLGRCECMPGYIQDMLQSGICKALTDQTDLQNIGVGVNSNSSSATNSPRNYSNQRQRSKRSEKPHRMERLQWPGPCDKDSQCPASLYCIQGDCWHLPDKPLRGVSHQNDEIPKSFPLETDEESSTTTPLPAFPQPPPPSSTPSGVFSEYGDAKPPSLRPLDYDESSFLGEFGAAFDVPSTTTTEKPITRMIGVEPFFSKKKASRRPKFGSGSSTESRPHLEEILETSTRTAFKRPRTEKFNEELEPLPPPKSRNPHVASGGWQPMHPHKASGVFRIPTTTPMDEMAKVFLDYSNRKRHPVRVEMTGARHVMRDECSTDRQCGEKYVCCEKRWCDLSRDCGRANFCLPNCHTTKMTYLSSTGIRGMPLIDLVYD